MRISQHNVRDYYSTYFSRFQCEFYSTHGKQPLSKLNLNYFQLWAYLNKRQVTINYPKSLPGVRILYTRQAITKHNVRYYYLTYLNCFQCEYYSTHGKQPLNTFDLNYFQLWVYLNKRQVIVKLSYITSRCENPLHKASNH